MTSIMSVQAKTFIVKGVLEGFPNSTYFITSDERVVISAWGYRPDETVLPVSMSLSMSNEGAVGQLHPRQAFLDMDDDLELYIILLGHMEEIYQQIDSICNGYTNMVAVIFPKGS